MLYLQTSNNFPDIMLFSTATMSLVVPLIVFNTFANYILIQGVILAYIDMVYL